LLRSLQEIQPDFVEEVKAKAGLWSQGKKNYAIIHTDGVAVPEEYDIQNTSCH
jgi:hypothetical protein